MKMKKLILIIFTLILLLGCATNHWTTISDLSKTGRCTKTSCGKNVQFDDGALFFFGSSPIDNSVGVMIYIPGGPQVGISIRMKDGKPSDPQLILVNGYGVLSGSCELEEAEKAVKKIMEMYKERSDKGE